MEPLPLNFWILSSLILMYLSILYTIKIKIYSIKILKLIYVFARPVLKKKSHKIKVYLRDSQTGIYVV